MAVVPFSTVLDLYFGLYHLSYSSDLGVDEQPLVDGTSSTTFVLKVLLYLFPCSHKRDANLEFKSENGRYHCRPLSVLFCSSG